MYPDPDPRIAQPIPVNIQNWDANKPVKPPFVKNTTVRTYIIDPTGATGAGKNVQITDYEPNRVRMAIIVVDAAVALVEAPPTTSPDASTASSAPSGAYLPPNASGDVYEFFGPDPWWLNSLGTITRVTVIKEYTN